MTEFEEITQESVQEHLKEVVALLNDYSAASALDEALDEPGPEAIEIQQQTLAQLQVKLNALHPADVAYMLEALPVKERLLVWDLVKAERDGEILLEVSDAVRETLIASMDSEELFAAAEQLDTDEIADLAPGLPRDVVYDILESLSAQDRARLQSALSYPEETVGALMDFELVTLREDITVEVALRYLRRFDELPSHTDMIFVVDREDRLRGALPLQRLLVSNLDTEVAAVMEREILKFVPEDDAHDAAQAFERYDLISAPVVDAEGKLVGRLTVDAVVDFIRTQSETEMLNLAGLREEEDIFSTVWKSMQNRWTWLAINLVTAFVASRVIGMFEGTIEKLVALAALMPIVAGIGGNSGNQTITMIVRALALGQLNEEHARQLFAKEIGVALLNGLIWGSILGLLAYLLYHNVVLGIVMTSAMMLNLLLAAVMGVVIPLTMHKLGRDPAVGSSVLITAVTDSGGFFIFLGLATVFLRFLE